MSGTEYRDWQPGDGLRCAYSKTAPREFPCGKPIMSSVSTQSPVGRADRTVIKAVCKNHAPGSVSPSVITTEARKRAVERLCSEYWNKFEKYYSEAIAALKAEHGLE